MTVERRVGCWYGKGTSVVVVADVLRFVKGVTGEAGLGAWMVLA
jgi:hypothetical protein